MNSIKEKRNIDSMLLALLRTELANRRTLLAYIKTSLGIGVTALALLKFMEAQSIFFFWGMIMIPLSILILTVVIKDFVSTKKKIEDEKEDAEV